MRHLKFTFRFLGVALFVLALVMPVLPTKVSVIADAGRPTAADNDDGDDDDDNDDDENRGSRRNPCRKAFKRAARGRPLPPECEPGGSGGAAKGDFNGDGFADLAVGSPFEDVDGVGGVGAVNIIYGSSAGLTASADQVLYETNFGFPLAFGDRFGAALASGDFNGDDFSDLAIGMPGYGSGTINDGVVFLIDGSANGLVIATHRTVPVISGKGGSEGAALVWADFNGDGFGDLAVGVPDAEVRGDGFLCSPAAFFSPAAGEVRVYYGSASGLTDFGAQIFRQGVCDFTDGIGIGDSVEENDRFGLVLAAGNFNGGSVADLVIGAPNEDLGLFEQDAGIVHLLHGSSSGLRDFNSQIVSQDTAGVGGAAEAGDQFGRALATGDLNGDTRDDLAVGAPFEDLISNNEADGGAVQVFFGTTGTALVDAAGDLFISQSNLTGTSVEAGDFFGFALAVGRFDSDSRADLAIGVPGEDIGSISDGGIVHVLYGSSTGPSFTNTQTWHQDSAGIPDVAEPGDQFGFRLSAWNYGKDSRSDLAIGVPFEDLVSTISDTLQADAGAVVVIYGTSTGLSATSANPAQFWHQDVSGINDAAQVGDHFGQALY